MHRIRLASVLAALLFAPTAAMAAEPSPYAGLEGRAIKALPSQAVDDLLAGNGMGLALAAELNGYPGPRHVIDLASALELSVEQRSETEALFRSMREEAAAIGGRLVEREAALDRLFADGRADEPAVTRLTEEIGRLQGALRLAHLRTHLRMKALLTAEQGEAYGRLRGYRGGNAPERRPPAGHGGHRHGG